MLQVRNMSILYGTSPHVIHLRVLHKFAPHKSRSWKEGTQGHRAWPAPALSRQGPEGSIWVTFAGYIRKQQFSSTKRLPAACKTALSLHTVLDLPTRAADHFVIQSPSCYAAQQKRRRRGSGGSRLRKWRVLECWAG
ncbi:hypothetical protein E2C01_077702 [Portunus trituberculatus]|uniref:Uncharacterized protein n=1 Tax=Portunus trituberculatus TaxID=210409 RepID=A0A5B7IKW4_PORTR|nr:hypothetical protein [Portunus trituberculatus]